MAINTYTKILNAGTQAAYNSLETKNPNLLYFCTDTGKLYKGTVDFTDSLVAAASKPETPVAGKIYVLADTNTVEAYIGGAWKVLSYPMTTTVDLNSDDVHVASAKAVYDAIQNAVEGLAGSSSTVKSVATGDADGQIKITKGDNTSENVTVKGVVTTPTWDSSSRKLTLPVAGAAAVEVEIGKDIFINPNADNKYNPETGNIEIYLNDGTAEKEDTKIEIPASALIDVYTGTTADGTSVTVTDDNKISVALVADNTDDQKVNGFTVTANGIMVDLTAYAKTVDVEGMVDVNTQAIAKLNGTASEEGSVAKAISDAVTILEAADTALANRVTSLESDNVTNKQNIADNTANIEALATATLEWGTF